MISRQLNQKIELEEIKKWYSRIINQRGIHNELEGVSSDDVRNWRRSLKAGEVSTGHMLYVLNLAGALRLGLPSVGKI